MTIFFFIHIIFLSSCQWWFRLAYIRLQTVLFNIDKFHQPVVEEVGNCAFIPHLSSSIASFLFFIFFVFLYLYFNFFFLVDSRGYMWRDISQINDLFPLNDRQTKSHTKIPSKNNLISEFKKYLFSVFYITFHIYICCCCCCLFGWLLLSVVWWDLIFFIAFLRHLTVNESKT